MRGSNIRISTHIQVKQSALCAFKQYFLAFLDSIICDNRGILDMDSQPVSIYLVFLQNSLNINRLTAVNTGDYLVLALTCFRHNRFKALRINKVMHAYTDTLGLVHISRANTLLGGTDIIAAPCLFTQCIQLQMPRKDTMRTCINIQLVSGNTTLIQSIHFTQNRLRIDNNTWSDNIYTIRIQNTGRNQL